MNVYVMTEHSNERKGFNISQFILSKHKQLLKILMQKMRAFLPLVIF